jgi:FlaA1/EpsC-like NDP-sugar epimerase
MLQRTLSSQGMSTRGTSFGQQHTAISGRPNLHEINWVNFLKRPIFNPSISSEKTHLAGRTILITGAGGSIGSALAFRLRHETSIRLILLDRSVQRLRRLRLTWEKQRSIGPRVDFVAADILDASALQEMFARFQPQIIFHTAALKQLPALESQPFSALENNVLGTLHLLELADCFRAQYFINISTDKAVKPTSVLGVSKRIAELMLMAMKPSAAPRLSIRLGNVLASSGSVVPAFIRAIKAHRPLAITDPQAMRYFVTLEEAAAFLIESLQVADSDLLLPEMGPPRRIVDLAAFVMKAHRASLEDGGLCFIGRRDGEKCSERLTYGYERLRTTAVRQIYQIVGSTVSDPVAFVAKVSRVLELVKARQKAGLIHALLDVVPEFEPSATMFRLVG